MGFLSGSAGDLFFGRQKSLIADPDDYVKIDTKITNWTLTSSAQLLDTTTLGDYDKTSVYGLRTHSGTLRLLYYTDPNLTSTVSASPKTNAASWFINSLIRAEIEDDASSLPPIGSEKEASIPVRLRLFLQKIGQVAKNEGNRDYIDVDANLTSVSFGSNVGELTALDVTFESVGRIVRSRV